MNNYRIIAESLFFRIPEFSNLADPCILRCDSNLRISQIPIKDADIYRQYRHRRDRRSWHSSSWLEFSNFL